MSKKFYFYSSFCIFMTASILAFTFSSCSKEPEKTQNTGKTDSSLTIQYISESNEDLLSVDYSYFYSQLSGKGEWVQMKAKDLGLNFNPKPTSKNYPDYYKLISGILGVRSVQAQTDEQLIDIFVWKPAMELATVMAGENSPGQYVPYNNGQWVYTDNGWYFKANTPEEEITSHYGRWIEDPNIGYVWVPGKVWAPAWVDWKQNQDYIAWAPIPPGTYVNNDAISKVTINENRYTVVEKKMFMEPSVYKYRYQYVENKNKVMIKEMTQTDGIIIKNKTVINKGPETADIEKITGKKIGLYKIKKTDKSDATGSTDEIVVYTPLLKQADVKQDGQVSRPDKYVSFQDAKNITKEQQEELKDKFKETKNEEKDIKKDSKEQDKEIKKDNKEKQKDEKENINKDKEKDKGNDKVKDKNDNVKKNEDKGHGKDNSDNDKGNKKSDDEGNKKGKK